MAELVGVFISYRRDDSPAQAGRLFDRISDRLGEESVFMDVDSIEPGVNFAEAIDNALAQCKVLLVVIGPTWLDSTDISGRRRIDDPRDFVRLEIEIALRRRIRVIPVLIDGAALPRNDQLPAELEELTYRQAVEIRHAQFRSDSRDLIEGVARIVGLSGSSAPTATALTPDRASMERTPAHLHGWSATLVKGGRSTRMLSIRLTHQIHRLEIKIRLNDTVTLDGIVVVKIVSLAERHNVFSIRDGANVHEADLWVSSTSLDKITGLRLIIDHFTIYEE